MSDENLLADCGCPSKFTSLQKWILRKQVPYFYILLRVICTRERTKIRCLLVIRFLESSRRREGNSQWETRSHPHPSSPNKIGPRHQLLLSKNETRFRRRFRQSFVGFSILTNDDDDPREPNLNPPSPSPFPLRPDTRSTFSSTPEASVVRRPRKMVARSGTSLIFHFVAYRYRGAAPRRRAAGHRYSLQASIQGGRKGGGRERPREKKERQI